MWTYNTLFDIDFKYHYLCDKMLDNIWDNIQYYIQVIPTENLEVLLDYGFVFEDNMLYFPSELLN